MIDLSKTIDLSTTYLGLKLKNPLVASSSPMCEDVANIQRMEDAGASAVVLHSLFEEQLTVESQDLDRFISAGENVGWESGYADPAAQVNTDFMASPEHRANILGSFDELGIGSWYDSGSWNYPGSGGGPYSNVYMFAEEFALVGAASAPAPVQTPSSGGSSGSQSAPTPAPTPTPTPKPPAPGVGSKEPRLAQGLLAGTIDQVIGSYLDE